MRIAVVGANGFIGAQVCASVIEHGLELVAVTRRPYSPPVRGIQHVVGTADARQLITAFSGCHVVVNAAGSAHQMGSADAAAEERFIAGNRSLPAAIAEAARTSGVKRIIHLSSAGVLGSSSGDGAFDDRCEPRPYDAYTKSKLDAEHVLGSVLAGATTELLCLRPPLVYGKGAPGNFARISGWARRGLPLPLGRCNAARAMIGVRNLANLVVYMATTGVVPARSLLCRDAETLTVADFAREVARRVSRMSIVVPVPLPVLSAAMALLGRTADLQRLSQPFRLDLSQGLDRTSWQAPFTLQQELDWSLSA